MPEWRSVDEVSACEVLPDGLGCGCSVAGTGSDQIPCSGQKELLFVRRRCRWQTMPMALAAWRGGPQAGETCQMLGIAARRDNSCAAWSRVCWKSRQNCVEQGRLVWSIVKQITGKRRKAPRQVSAIKKAEKAVSTSAEIGGAGHSKFLEVFRSHGEVTCAAAFCELTWKVGDDGGASHVQRIGSDPEGQGDGTRRVAGAASVGPPG